MAQNFQVAFLSPRQAAGKLLARIFLSNPPLIFNFSVKTTFKMSQYLLLISALASGLVWAGSSSIDLTDSYQHVFATPSGNILCGGNSSKRPQSGLYANDLYCFVANNQAMPRHCFAEGRGLNFTLNAKGSPRMSCAGFQFGN